MDVRNDVIRIVARVLDIGDRSRAFNADTRLLGSVPEFDSMAVATLIGALEDHFGITVDDDEIDGSKFETIQSLVDFIDAKLGR